MAAKRQEEFRMSVNKPSSNAFVVETTGKSPLWELASHYRQQHAASHVVDPYLHKYIESNCIRAAIESVGFDSQRNELIVNVEIGRFLTF